MLEAPTISPLQAKPTTLDRPGWIPPEITHNWDINPYAYQTEEELMSAGGTHNQLLAYMMELLRHPLKEKGLMLLMDTFLLYRDAQGIKQRIAPDLLLMPYRSEAPSAYDLDVEPPPACVIEVTSPKSHLKDLQNNISFYFGLGIQTYLVIDAITPQSKRRPQIQLYLWRSIKGKVQEMSADAEGYLTLPDMNLKIRAIGQRIILVDTVTDEVLFDNSDFVRALAEERAARQIAEEKIRQIAEEKATTARQEIALAMWQKGLDLTLIAEVTGISETALKKLIEQKN